MDRNFYYTDFEELIKEKADQYKMYPSDKVWKGVNRSLHTRRKWYWTSFVVLLSGISYFAITELISPVSSTHIAKVVSAPHSDRPVLDPEQLVPFSADIAKTGDSPETAKENGLVTVDENGTVTETFETILPPFLNQSLSDDVTGSLVITRPMPFTDPERFDIELSWPVTDRSWKESYTAPGKPATASSLVQQTAEQASEPKENRINWLQEHAAFRMPGMRPKRISWQLAFSPTINYRKLTGNGNAYMKSAIANVPLALRIEGAADNLVNHKPALGFELGTHAMYNVDKRLSLKAGVQFNYSRYDIAAFSSPSEQATISLNNTYGTVASSITNYSSIRNFGGTAVKDLRNQYFQLSVPVGLELRLLGNDRLQLNIAGTVQPTYLINANTYLITTDYKNYTKEPSLVRKWNVNTGAEAFISYSKAGVKWQVGPQFRYQLFSSYSKEYPIKEYLMEYGIKIGITKTIR